MTALPRLPQVEFWMSWNTVGFEMYNFSLEDVSSDKILHKGQIYKIWKW
jgi:hypothetical protein